MRLMVEAKLSDSAIVRYPIDLWLMITSRDCSTPNVMELGPNEPIQPPDRGLHVIKDVYSAFADRNS